MDETVIEERIRAGSVGLRFAHARPPLARATVVVLPGRGEFIEKYAETTGDLLARGFATAHVEWRGQGLSDRLLPLRDPGHINDYREYLEDLRAALDRCKELELPRPFVMLAHSMGGQIGLRFLHDAPGAFAAAVMTAPMWGIRLEPLPFAGGTDDRRCRRSARRPLALRAGPGRMADRPLRLRGQSADRLPGPVRALPSTPGDPARAGAGRRHLRLAGRQPALDRADATARLPRGDRDARPGLPGRSGADRLQPQPDRACPPTCRKDGWSCSPTPSTRS